MRVPTAGVCTAALVLAVAWAGAAGVSREQADSFARKVTLIEQQGSKRSGAPRRTAVSETEVNSWFTYTAPPLLPTGVTNPRVVIAADSVVTGTAIVDLDAVARSRASGRTFDIWNLVGGKVPVKVTGLVRADGGRARFDMQEAYISSIPVPRRVVEEIVDYYSRTADHPQGVRLDQEFELPAGIQDIELTPGAAVVIQ